MIDIGNISTNLDYHDGIWSTEISSQISYPDSGNRACLAIEENSFWFKHRNECIAAALRNFAPPGTLFDVGGGNGYVSLGLKQRGFEVVLVEPGVEGVVNAKARGVEPLIHSSLEAAGFKKGSLPAIGAFDVIEHIDDDLGFLKSAKELLTKDGRIYLTVPAYNALWSAEDEYAEHFRRYRAGQLQSKLSKVGFEPEYITYIFWPLPFPIFFARTLPSLLGLRKGSSLDTNIKEHSPKKGALSEAFRRLLHWELSLVAKKRSVPFGGSVLAVAKRG